MKNANEMEQAFDLIVAESLLAAIDNCVNCSGGGNLKKNPGQERWIGERFTFKS